jgi:DNA mismatch repair protein MutS2
VVRRKQRKNRPPSHFPDTNSSAAGLIPELDLHALTVVEALPRLDEFLHDSFQTGHYRVRVNHGKGTGVLKLEVGRYLSGHPLVLGYRPADRWHGGEGVTEVDLSYR